MKFTCVIIVPLRTTTFFVFAAIVILGSAITPSVWAQCSPLPVNKLTASDAASFDIFGVSTAISGDTLVVGAYFDDKPSGVNVGSAYVYVKSGGLWVQHSKLVASNPISGNSFGVSVCIEGDTIVVGARGELAGAAYVFVRNGGVWSQQARLTTTDGVQNDQFGDAVSIQGNSLIVGAPLDDHPGRIDAGSAYVFVRSGSNWIQQAKLVASDGDTDDRFGDCVAISGNASVVGARLHDHDAGDNAGAAYAYARSGITWTQQAKLTAADGSTNDFFGTSVAMSGETAVIGAYGDDHPGWTDNGSAYVFVRSGAAWFQQGKLIGTDVFGGNWSGWSVAVSGEMALVSAHLQGNGGAAYLFARSNGFWVQQAKLTAADALSGDAYSYSVGLSGDSAVIGSILDDNAGGTDAGSAYTFTLNCDADEDGVLNSADACPNNTLGLPICPNGRPLRDCNNDCRVDAADVQCIVDEMLGQ